MVVVQASKPSSILCGFGLGLESGRELSCWHSGSVKDQNGSSSAFKNFFYTVWIRVRDWFRE